METQPVDQKRPAVGIVHQPIREEELMSLEMHIQLMVPEDDRTSRSCREVTDYILPEALGGALTCSHRHCGSLASVLPWTLLRLARNYSGDTNCLQGRAT